MCVCMCVSVPLSAFVCSGKAQRVCVLDFGASLPSSDSRDIKSSLADVRIRAIAGRTFAPHRRKLEAGPSRSSHASLVGGSISVRLASIEIFPIFIFWNEASYGQRRECLRLFGHAMSTRPEHVQLPNPGTTQAGMDPASSRIAPLSPPHEHVRLGSRLGRTGSRMRSDWAPHAPLGAAIW